MKSYQGMGATWFSLSTWTTFAFWAQVIAWTLGFLVILAGVASYWARSNATFLKEQQAEAKALEEQTARAPRALSTSQHAAIVSKLKGTGMPVLIISLGDLEAGRYADQLAAALKEGEVRLSGIRIGVMMPPAYGLQVWGGSDAASQLTAVLRDVGLQVRQGDGSLPIPSSVAGRLAEFVPLVVGLKPPH